MPAEIVKAIDDYAYLSSRDYLEDAKRARERLDAAIRSALAAAWAEAQEACAKVCEGKANVWRAGRVNAVVVSIEAAYRDSAESIRALRRGKGGA